MSVLDGVEIVEGKGQSWDKCGASRCNRGFCGVIILCREGWRRGSSQITLVFLVKSVLSGNEDSLMRGQSICLSTTNDSAVTA